jgi:hypothetical protein
VLAAAAAVVVGGDGTEMGAVLAAAAATGVGGGGAEMGAVLAAIAATGVGGGGAVLAAITGLDAETNALGESRWEKSMLKPAPRAMEKRMVRTVPNGVVTAWAKVTIQLVFLFITRMTGGTRTNVLVSFFCVLISPSSPSCRGTPQALALPDSGSDGTEDKRFQVVSSTASIVERRDSSLYSM